MLLTSLLSRLPFPLFSSAISPQPVFAVTSLYPPPTTTLPPQTLCPTSAVAQLAHIAASLPLMRTKTPRHAEV